MSVKVLVITPVHHIRNVCRLLESIGTVKYLPDPSIEEVIEIVSEFDAIFTNPNKSKVYLGQEILGKGSNLKVICTASTGTNHIDLDSASRMGIKVISLTDERRVINQISATAELAFALTLASIRHLVVASQSVTLGEWDYEKFIGRQMNSLTIGVVGYGRLGKIYSKFCLAFGARVVAFDPLVTVNDEGVEQMETLDQLITISDVISLHVHVSVETEHLIGYDVIKQLKPDVSLVNTSRGEILDEVALVEFLKINPRARIATDVLTNELTGRLRSPLYQYSRESAQVIITPHIGGMCREAQELAYGHAATLLKNFFRS